MLADLHGVEVADSVDGLHIDAAVVAVPTESHAAIAAPLLRRGVHCFIEKPVAGDVNEARALIAASEESGAVIQVGHIERFSAAFEALEEAVGTVGHIAARRHNLPRAVPPAIDVVLDLMIHDIDLALALANAPVTSFSAHAPDGIGHECATAQLCFANGVVADLSASRLAPSVDRTIIVHDEKGVWQADLAEKTLHRTIDGAVHEILLDTARDSLALEIDEFVEAACGRLVPRVDGCAGLEAVRIANEIRGALAPLTLQLTA